MPEIVIIPPGENLSLSPTASAFAHGFGLFETMRLAGGKLYFWGEHWARLSSSADHFGLPLPQEEAVLAAVRELVVSADLNEAILKLSLVRGGAGSRLYVYSRPPMATPDGSALLLDSGCPVFERSTLAGHKTHSYMENMHLLQRARSKGFYDLIRVDSQGNLAETTTANLFFLREGVVHTPALETGILPGVTRGVLLRSCGLPVEEGFYAPERLLEADSVLVCNATSGIQPVERIDGFPRGETRSFEVNSPALNPILAAYRDSADASAMKLR